MTYFDVMNFQEEDQPMGDGGEDNTPSEESDTGGDDKPSEEEKGGTENE